MPFGVGDERVKHRKLLDVVALLVFAEEAEVGFVGGAPAEEEELVFSNGCFAEFAGMLALKLVPGSKRKTCLLYTSPSPRDRTRSRMPSSA